MPHASAAPPTGTSSADPPVDRRAARLDLRGRPGAPADDLGAGRLVHRRRGPGALARGAYLRVLGARGLLLPIELWPHFRGVMEGAGHWGSHDRAMREHADLVEPRARADPQRGAARLARLRGQRPRRRDVELEAGEDGARGAVGPRPARDRRPARASSAQYDLAERVIPKHVARGADAERGRDATATFALLAVGARGALTEAAIREHWRLKGGKARLHHHLDALVDEGRLREVEVDDGGAPFYVLAGHRARRRSGAAGARLPVRQPGLGPAAARAPLRLPPRDRGLQARARAASTATTCCRSSPATGSSAAPT